MASDRFERGLKRLAEVDGPAGQAAVEHIRRNSPDLARYTVEFPFGDIYSRPGLELRDRELATLGMLAALGNAWPQFKVHVHAALHVGLTRAEIEEVCIQTAVYAGFPAALNAMAAAGEAFQEME